MAAPHAGEAALAASLAALGVDASLQPLDCIEEEAIVVKSLVFTLSPGGEAVLVVVPLAAKVCTTKLGAALGRRRNDVRLATPEARAASREPRSLAPHARSLSRLRWRPPASL